jgi:hypothetical protein
MSIYRGEDTRYGKAHLSISHALLRATIQEGD